MGWLDWLTRSSPIISPVTRGIDEAQNVWAERGSVTPYANDVRAGAGMGSGIVPSQNTPFSPYAPRDPQLGAFAGQRVQGPATVTPDTVDPNAGSGQNFPRGGGSIAANQQVPGLLENLEAQRQAMMARRNAAISAAGRGAGAPYSAAIARLDDEIAKTQGQLGRMGPLFDNKQAINKVAWDNAAKELPLAADEALAEMELINKQQFNAIASQFSDSQSRASDVMGLIGADDATRAAVASEVGALEDEIMEMDEVNAKGRSRILQASEDLAVASAAAAGATNALELKRNQIIVESDLKENINKMIADREQQVRARNAAVSAARDLEAARWPEAAGIDRNGYAQEASRMALDRLMGRAPQATKEGVGNIAELFSMFGVSTTHARKILTAAANGDDGGSGRNIASRYNITDDQYNMLLEMGSSVLRSAMSHVPIALETYDKGLTYYDQNIAEVDPWDLPTGSASQYMSAYNRFLGMGMSEADARGSAMDYSNSLEAGRDMSALEELLGGGR